MGFLNDLIDAITGRTTRTQLADLRSRLCDLEARADVDEQVVTELTEQVQRQGEDMSAEIDQLRSDMDAATTAIADRIQRILDKLDGADAAVLAEFQPVLDNLRALGVDPADPLPEPAPEPEPTP